ncbi:MAG: ATP-binding protein [Cytophagales bacterium]|nr:MAG: ATP-binding protein [Cytophagales bacterium]
MVDRTSDKILFNRQPTIKLSQQESILSLLKEEELVKPAHESLRKLHFSNQLGFAENVGTDLLVLNKQFLSQYNTLKKIQESDFKTSAKLFLVSQLEKSTIFNIIKERFVSIFPTVEDLKVEIKNKGIFSSFAQKSLDIKIKESGVDKWIELPRMSWGMVRTLKQLSELYLCAEGTVFLIDEFENSLGINCINEITNDILASRRQLQFILTSHHPYIIDAIGFDNWKLVTRNGGIIKTHNIDRFGIGKSKHSAFMQLLQLEEYQTGQEQL